MASLYSFMLVAFGFLTSTYCLKIENLGGKWTVKDSTGKYNNLNATVPGGIYSDLMNNSLIGDILYGYNDTATRWVAQNNWTYSRQFFGNDSILTYQYINLVFEGLDTFSTVLVNDIELGTTQNMFLRYIFDVKKILKPGDNTIEIRFVSPIVMAETLTLRENYTVPPNCPASQSNGECHINQIRKMQASFSWDWGPAFPSMGIWKDIYLEAFNTSVIRYVLFNYTDAPNDSWLITTSTYLHVEQGQHIEGQIIHELETDVSVIYQMVDVNYTNTAGDYEAKIDFAFLIPQITVKRWWPNGYGDQKLYSLKTTFKSGAETDSKSMKIGFREIELVQEPIGNGLSFYFKVNGVAIFAKGANQIPLDILPEKGQDPETVWRILKSAHDTNMNMLRVWGGGVYESDFFYEKCDELGILIWQDFMFACALYPTYPTFLSNVKEEVRHQVKRLYNHPSIAIWAGNNENEVALMTNWYGTKANISLYKKDYITLYIDTIRNELFNVSKDVIFIASSPSNGKESEEEDYLATDPQNPQYGDVHFYNYLTNSLEYKTYPIPRFASEFGYQSLPDVDTWLTVTDNLTDLDPSGPFMEHRQHHPFGFLENTLLINYQLSLNASSKNYFKTYIFYSQIVQAMSVKFETEYYRSFMGRLDSGGRGNTMGALFWQLCDVWVAPTWSSIDYTGKWKMLQYFAQDFFAPTIITGYLDTQRQLKIFVVSEVASLFGAPFQASVMVDVYKWNVFGVINSTQLDVILEFGKSIDVAVINTDTFLSSAGCGSSTEAKANCFIQLSLTVGDTPIAPSNFVFPVALKHSALSHTEVQITSCKQIDDQGKKFAVTVQTNGISIFVWLDSHQIRGRFSENGFIQLKPTKAVTFQSEDIISANDLKKAITVTHLMDSEML